MFTAWVQDSSGDCVKCYEDCMQISVYSFSDMMFRFPDILDAIGFECNYFCLTDSQGRHFYPLYIYSVNIG